MRKEELTEEEVEYNEKLYEETLAVLFPEEKMRDKFYRDKVRFHLFYGSPRFLQNNFQDKEAAARAWILTVRRKRGGACSVFTVSLCFRS